MKKKPVETLNRVRLELENEMKKCLWLPNYSKEYNFKRNLINYKSTKQKFKVLKNKISKKDTDLKNNKSKTVIEKIAIIFFSIFNLIPLMIINSVLKKVEDRVFHLSIKYLVGIFIFPLWWTIVFFISFYFLNLPLSFVVVTFLVLFLFLRQFLIIKYK